MNLAEKLASMREGAHARFGAEIVGVMKRATEELRNSGIMQTALNVGQTAPEFILPNMNGEPVSSAELQKKGVLVVTFYRGVW